MTFEENFKSRLLLVDDCLEWQGARGAFGHGAVWFRGRVWIASRVAWTLSKGEIPKELHVLHKCDNPCCCNVEHLFLGTQSDNNKDKVNKGRQPNGESHGMSKLTKEQVEYIKTSDKAGTILAKELAVHRNTIYNIRLNKRWNKDYL